MRQTIYILAMVLLLASCNNGGKGNNANTSDSQADINSILHGSWYDAGYIADLKQTQSPAKSFEVLKDFVEINIDTTKMVGNTLEVEALNIHEGGGFKIIFTPGVKPNSFKTDIVDYENEDNFFEVGYTVSPTDTVMTLYLYGADNSVIKKVDYKKGPHGLNNVRVVPYMVNKTLLSGSYSRKDKNGRDAGTVTFTDDGTITGLEDFTTYSIMIDFVVSPQNPHNRIIFELMSEDIKQYAFELKGDTLKLYEITDKYDVMEEKLGELKYELVRIE